MSHFLVVKDKAMLIGLAFAIITVFLGCALYFCFSVQFLR